MMRKAMPAVLLVASWLGLAGCATTGTPVTGTNKEDPSTAGSQSETATAVANFAAKSVITVAFNDHPATQGSVTYTATTRTVTKGASMMGWAKSEDRGASWKYGGNVSATDDWPVIWGDPGITSVASDQRYVFLSNLAVPKSLMPADGTIEGGLGNYIGGACIARSADGGKTFAMWQCVHENFAFYDGASMASSTRGDVYASFINVDNRQHAIWHAKTPNDQFTKLPNPFPGCEMAGHPRIRVGYPGVSLGQPDISLFVAGQIIQCNAGALGKESGGYGQVIINRYHNGSWGTPRPASNPAAVYPAITLSDRKLRTGPQFSFDVGAPSQDDEGNSHHNEIRMLVTRWSESEKRYFVEGSYCRFDLSTPCKPAPEWGSTPGYYSYKGDQFAPLVRAFPGFLSVPAAWAGSFATRDHAPAGNTVALRRGSLAIFPNGTRFMIAFDFVAPKLVCGDNRGYWGDYDDLQFIGFAENSVNARFLRTFTDSSAGCTKQWEYTSDAVHVSAAAFP